MSEGKEMIRRRILKTSKGDRLWLLIISILLCDMFCSQHFTFEEDYKVRAARLLCAGVFMYVHHLFLLPTSFISASPHFFSIGLEYILHCLSCPPGHARDCRIQRCRFCRGQFPLQCSGCFFRLI